MSHSDNTTWRIIDKNGTILHITADGTGTETKRAEQSLFDRWHAKTSTATRRLHRNERAAAKPKPPSGKDST